MGERYYFLYSLDHIETIEGNLEIVGLLNTLDTLNAFKRLRQIHGNLTIDLELKMLDGFDSLKIIVGQLDLKDFSEVNPINAFQNLNIVCGELVLDEVPATETFFCFSNLQFGGVILVFLPISIR